jgi:predicted PhzF superfamily epimerase YddE/YHI9
MLSQLTTHLGLRGVIVTSESPAGANYDFVSRFFAPGVGIDEDPVTGSAHTKLAPFWGKQLEKPK